MLSGLLVEVEQEFVGLRQVAREWHAIQLGLDPCLADACMLMGGCTFDSIWSLIYKTCSWPVKDVVVGVLLWVLER